MGSTQGGGSPHAYEQDQRSQVTLRRQLTSFQLHSILAAYIAVSIAIVVVAFYHSWEGCRIALQYGASSSDYYCAVGGGWTFFSPWTLILFVPVTASMALVVLGVIRWQISASLKRRIIFTLTTVPEVSLILIILGSLFGVAIDHEHAGKQCGGWVNGIPHDMQQSCDIARTKMNSSDTFLPIQVALCVAGIVLTYVYWRYYGRVALA
jgi:hypothetical protein